MTTASTSPAPEESVGDEPSVAPGPDAVVEPASPEADDASISRSDGPVAPTTVLAVRVEPSGLGAERAVAVACATGDQLRRDPDAPLGRPAAMGVCEDGEEVLGHLITAAALALDETDLHLTVRRR